MLEILEAALRVAVEPVAIGPEPDRFTVDQQAARAVGHRRLEASLPQPDTPLLGDRSEPDAARQKQGDHQIGEGVEFHHRLLEAHPRIGQGVADVRQDLSQDEDVARIVEIARSELGGVDILVNNAAGGGHQNDMVTPPSEWLESYDVNVLSMVRLIQQLLPPMQEQGWGRIINISSAAGVNPAPGMGVYSTTKAAVLNLTVTMAQAMEDDGVTINAVSPGAILTPNMVEMAKSQGMGETLEEVEAAMSQMMNSVPFRRMGRVEEVADVVVFLASSLASYIHGANIRVDGGWVATVN